MKGQVLNEFYVFIVQPNSRNVSNLTPGSVVAILLLWRTNPEILTFVIQLIPVTQCLSAKALVKYVQCYTVPKKNNKLPITIRS